MGTLRKIAIVVSIIVIITLYLIYAGYLMLPININKYLHRANKTTTSTTPHELVSSEISTTSTVKTTSKASTWNSTSFYNLVINFKDMIYRVLDTSYGNQCMRLGFHRINITDNGIVFVNIFTENCTQVRHRTMDLILGINKDDEVIYARGNLDEINISGSEGRIYAEQLLLDFKSMILNLVNSDVDIEITVNELIMNDTRYNLSYDEKTLFSINGRTYNAYLVVLEPISPDTHEINETIILAELMPNIWFLVHEKVIYEDTSIQDYKLVKLEI